MSSIDDTISKAVGDLVDSTSRYQSALDKNKGGAGGKYTKEMQGLQSEETSLSKKLDTMQTPSAPKLNKDMPAAPTPENVNPMDVFKEFAPALAVFGSLATHRPLTAALNSGAAAMQAYKQGKAEEYEQKRQKWKDDLEVLTKKNQEELDEFHAAMESSKGDMNLMQAKFSAISAKYEHANMLHTIAAGDQKTMIDMYQKSSEVQAKLVETLGKLKKDMSSGAPTLTEPAVDKFADMIHSGVRPSALGLGYGNNANKTAVMNKYAEKYPNDSLGDVELDYAERMSEMHKAGINTAGMIGAANNLEQAIPLMLTAAQGVDLTKFKNYNELANTVRSGTGDPNIVRLEAAVKAVMSDYATLISRTGQSTDSTRAAAQEIVNSAMAQGQLSGVADQMIQEGQSVRRAAQKTKEEILSRSPSSAPSSNSSGWKIEEVK